MASVKGRAAAAVIAAAALGASIAAEPLVEFEGWELMGYGDIANPKLATGCAGVTKGIELKAKYSQQGCESRTGQALIEHAIGIAHCLPADLPPNVRAAFTLHAYNFGVAAHCKSGIAQAARAGNLPLACRRLTTHDNGKPAWVYAGGIKLPGLVARRHCERTLCESGLPGSKVTEADWRKACRLDK